jgi:hypothetical protein
MRLRRAERLLEQFRREGPALLGDVLFRENLVTDITHSSRV